VKTKRIAGKKMTDVSDQESLISTLARKVGRAAGKIASATHGLATSAAAIVESKLESREGRADVPAVTPPPLPTRTTKPRYSRGKLKTGTLKSSPKTQSAPKRTTSKKKSSASSRKKKSPSR
jgi:hypothetical protein